MKKFIVVIIFILGFYMEVFAKSENYFIGKWIYDKGNIFIMLEIKRNGEIFYYTHTRKDGEIASENWLEGKYEYERNETIKTDELIITYTMAEYSPYGFSGGMPTSYADSSIEENSIITLYKENKNSMKVCFSDYEKNFGVHEKCLVMIKDSGAK